jgi:hypothetical protein
MIVIFINLTQMAALHLVRDKANALDGHHDTSHRNA